MPPNALQNAPNRINVAADLSEVKAAIVAVILKAPKVKAPKVKAPKVKAPKGKAPKGNSGLAAKVRDMVAREEDRGNAWDNPQVKAINLAISVERAAVGVAVVLVEARAAGKVAVADNSVVAHAVDVSARVAGANLASQSS